MHFLVEICEPFLLFKVLILPYWSRANGLFLNNICGGENDLCTGSLRLAMRDQGLVKHSKVIVGAKRDHMILRTFNVHPRRTRVFDKTHPFPILLDTFLSSELSI